MAHPPAPPHAFPLWAIVPVLSANSAGSRVGGGAWRGLGGALEKDARREQQPPQQVKERSFP